MQDEQKQGFSQTFSTLSEKCLPSILSETVDTKDASTINAATHPPLAAISVAQRPPDYEVPELNSHVTTEVNTKDAVNPKLQRATMPMVSSGDESGAMNKG